MEAEVNEMVLTRHHHLANHAFWRWRPDPEEPSYGLVCTEEGGKFGFPHWESSVVRVRLRYSTVPQPGWHRVWLPDPRWVQASIDDQPPVPITDELYNLLLDKLTVYYHVEAL